MYPLKALFLLRRILGVASLLGFAIAAGCQGPDAFFRLTDAGQQSGTGGSVSAPGSAGTTGAGGQAGTLSAAGNAGTTGSAGAAGSTAGSIASGNAGTTGSAGVTGSGGAAGSTGGRGGTTGTAGRGGTTGTAGTTGAAGASGAAGTTGVPGTTGAAGSTGGRGGTTGTAGRGGTTGAAGATGTGGGSDRLQIQAYCQNENDAQDIRVTFRIVNPESVAKQYSDIKVRYYFTPNAALVPSAVIDYAQKFPANMFTLTATASYVEVGFAAGAGMLPMYDTVTGSDQIKLRIYNFMTPIWNNDYTDDWSNVGCAGGTTMTYVDRPRMPAYYQGELAWGSEPYPAP